jgi:hypothetical protein
MRWQRIAIIIAFVLAFATNAQSAKIVKVLPQFLDLKGRNSISPSLFDRDAYQVVLRDNPDKRSGIRFGVQWKAPPFDVLTLRIEAKGVKGKQPQLITLERPVKPGLYSQWTSATLGGERYAGFGDMVSWRATLLDGTNVIAEQKSFLW